MYVTGSELIMIERQSCEGEPKDMARLGLPRYQGPPITDKGNWIFTRFFPMPIREPIVDAAADETYRREGAPPMPAA